MDKKTELQNYQDRLAYGDQALTTLKEFRMFVGMKCRPYLIKEFHDHLEEINRILFMHKGIMHHHIEEEIAKEKESAALDILKTPSDNP